ncbi:hypothetical protein EON82_18995 [bacterium]|nr:MAG: hypothetical protein EON82_18995 [bacterium]
MGGAAALARARRTEGLESAYLTVDCAQALAEDCCPGAIERAHGLEARRLYEEARANAFVAGAELDLWDEQGLIEALPRRLAG